MSYKYGVNSGYGTERVTKSVIKKKSTELRYYLQLLTQALEAENWDLVQFYGECVSTLGADLGFETEALASANLTGICPNHGVVH